MGGIFLLTTYVIFSMILKTLPINQTGLIQWVIFDQTFISDYPLIIHLTWHHVG